MLLIKEKAKAILCEKFPQFELNVSMDSRNVLTVAGEADTWQRVVEIGHAMAKLDGVKNVVSDMTVKGLEIPKRDYSEILRKGTSIGVTDEADVVVVGLGITGCGVIRELSKYNLKIIAVEMGDDVCTGVSKANNGGVHMAGMVKPGSLKARLSVRGNELYEKWAEELGFEFVRIGQISFTEDISCIERLKDIFVTAVKNKDKRPALLDGEQTLEIAPEIKSKLGADPVASAWLPSQAHLHPYKVCVALAENAVGNGVKIILNCAVGGVLTDNGAISAVVTNKGIIKTRYLVNAAGIYADDIAEMAGDRFFTLHNRKGVIAVIDKHKEPASEHLIMKHDAISETLRDEETKGVKTDLTPSKNILIGPSATEVPDKEDTEVTPADFEFVMSGNNNPNVSSADVIRIFAGARPADFKEDFIVEMSELVDGLIIAGAIQSPGLGSSPAIAELIESIIKEDMEARGEKMETKPDFNPVLEKRVNFSTLSHEEQAELISKRPEYGKVICRCETITEGEILDAIHSPIVPASIDAIKRRTRAGMGRCQGGFCQPRVLEILARELGKEWTEITLRGEGTNILKTVNR